MGCPQLSSAVRISLDSLKRSVVQALPNSQDRRRLHDTLQQAILCQLVLSAQNAAYFPYTSAQRRVSLTCIIAGP